MFGWIYSHLVTFLTYLIAPIVFHTSCDSYVLLFIFTVLELTDTFTGYRIYILFVTAGLLLRNYLFNFFKTSRVLNKNPNSSQNIKNNLKNLIINPFNLSKPLVSNNLQLFKNLLRK